LPAIAEIAWQSSTR